RTGGEVSMALCHESHRPGGRADAAGRPVAVALVLGPMWSGSVGDLRGYSTRLVHLTDAGGQPHGVVRRGGSAPGRVQYIRPIAHPTTRDTLLCSCRLRFAGICA